MAGDVASAARDEEVPKGKIFISYSRKDLAFADRLEAALKERGFQPLIDRTDIYAFADWWKSIEALIVDADTIVFVLSPDAIASEICAKEVAFAASLNKRFAPIVCRHVDEKAVPEALRRLNFIFFAEEARFEESADKLAEALVTDIAWIKRHTEFGGHARRWAEAGRPGPRGLLLRSPVLEEAEQWIASRPREAPLPTEAIQAFIAESRRAATQRRNVLTATLAAGLIVALGLAGFAYWQRGIALRNEALANERRDQALTTQSRFLADLANQSSRKNDFAAAILLALEGLPDARGDTVMPYVPEAETALSGAYQRLQESGIRNFDRRRNQYGALSPDRRRAVRPYYEYAEIVDTETGTVLLTLSHARDVQSAAFSPEGGRVITISDDTSGRISKADTGDVIVTLDGASGDVSTASFSPDGRRVATASTGNTARIWATDSGAVLATLEGHTNRVTHAEFIADGRRLFTLSHDNTVRIWDAGNGR